MASMMRFIVSTDSTGNSPMAVSPESMQASAPSRIALATSVASARVGRRLWCMLSSICVATITGLPCRWHSAHDPLLHDGDLGHVHFDAQIAAGDHHALGSRDDLADLLHGFGLFDFGDRHRAGSPVTSAAP